MVGVLPKVAGVTDDFFNAESTFSRMKEGAVFINIGRGTTLKEEDLVTALNDQAIAGAVLDVYQKEPLARTSALWSCKNLFMTPHCADQDEAWLIRAFEYLGKNLEIYATKGAADLLNICDKEEGY